MNPTGLEDEVNRVMETESAEKETRQWVAEK